MDDTREEQTFTHVGPTERACSQMKTFSWSFETGSTVSPQQTIAIYPDSHLFFGSLIDGRPTSCVCVQAARPFTSNTSSTKTTSPSLTTLQVNPYLSSTLTKRNGPNFLFPKKTGRFYWSNEVRIIFDIQITIDVKPSLILHPASEFPMRHLAQRIRHIICKSFNHKQHEMAHQKVIYYRIGIYSPWGTFPRGGRWAISMKTLRKTLESESPCQELIRSQFITEGSIIEYIIIRLKDRPPIHVLPPLSPNHHFRLLPPSSSPPLQEYQHKSAKTVDGPRACQKGNVHDYVLQPPAAASGKQNVLERAQQSRLQWVRPRTGRKGPAPAQPLYPGQTEGAGQQGQRRGREGQLLSGADVPRGQCGGGRLRWRERASDDEAGLSEIKDAEVDGAQLHRHFPHLTFIYYLFALITFYQGSNKTKYQNHWMVQMPEYLIFFSPQKGAFNPSSSHSSLFFEKCWSRSLPLSFMLIRLFLQPRVCFLGMEASSIVLCLSKLSQRLRLSDLSF